jgi:hypothetical protein
MNDDFKRLKPLTKEILASVKEPKLCTVVIDNTNQILFDWFNAFIPGSMRTTCPEWILIALRMIDMAVERNLVERIPYFKSVLLCVCISNQDFLWEETNIGIEHFNLLEKLMKLNKCPEDTDYINAKFLVSTLSTFYKLSTVKTLLSHNLLDFARFQSSNLFYSFTLTEQFGNEAFRKELDEYMASL